MKISFHKNIRKILKIIGVQLILLSAYSANANTNKEILFRDDTCKVFIRLLADSSVSVKDLAGHIIPYAFRKNVVYRRDTIADYTGTKSYAIRIDTIQCFKIEKLEIKYKEKKPIFSGNINYYNSIGYIVGTKQYFIEIPDYYIISPKK